MKLNDIVNEINDFIDESPLNGVEELGIVKMFDYPLIGVAVAEDPLFLKLKDHSVVGEHFLMPAEWLPGAQAVISYFLPFSERIREANRVEGLPAMEWVYGRYEGEVFNEALRRHIVEVIEAETGAEAIAPMLDSRFEIVGKISSNWSERHVAFISGLGTFSLSRSLITSKGCAGRFGSVIINLPIPATRREYTEVYQYCTMCGECIDRCPAEAISMAETVKREGMNKIICEQYCHSVVFPQFKPRYGCGKCQTAIPCEDRIPE